ncbi:hypothetical protein [Spirillospora sp. NPDC047279]|uniref:hypothetical protein n=1 Tax=Spirillospora sp. NPDC047279 TaxID=3155478 RepID=UPI0033F9686C
MTSTACSALPAATPWDAAEQDPDLALRALRRLFPRVQFWFGEYTGRYWAMAVDRRGQHLLAEATSPEHLRRLVEFLGYRPPLSRPLQAAASTRPPAGSPSSQALASPPVATIKARHARPRRHLRRRLLGFFLHQSTDVVTNDDRPLPSYGAHARSKR